MVDNEVYKYFPFLLFVSVFIMKKVIPTHMNTLDAYSEANTMVFNMSPVTSMLGPNMSASE